MEENVKEEKVVMSASVEKDFLAQIVNLTQVKTLAFPDSVKEILIVHLELHLPMHIQRREESLHFQAFDVPTALFQNGQRKLANLRLDHSQEDLTFPSTPSVEEIALPFLFALHLGKTIFSSFTTAVSLINAISLHLKLSPHSLFSHFLLEEREQVFPFLLLLDTSATVTGMKLSFPITTGLPNSLSTVVMKELENFEKFSVDESSTALTQQLFILIDGVKIECNPALDSLTWQDLYK